MYSLLAAGIGFLMGYLVKQFLAGKSSEQLETMWSEKVRRASRELDTLRTDLKAQTQRTDDLDRAVDVERDRLKKLEAALAVEMEQRDGLLAKAEAQVAAFETEHTEWKARLDAVTAQAANIEADLKVRLAEQEELIATLRSAASKPVELDDLKLIPGVGKVMEKRLREHGVQSFKQIAMWTAQDILAFEGHLPEFQRRAERDRWIAGAKDQHFKKYGEAL